MRKADALVCPNGYVNIGGRCVKREFASQNENGRYELDVMWMMPASHSLYQREKFTNNPSNGRIPREIIPYDDNTGIDNYDPGTVLPTPPSPDQGDYSPDEGDYTPGVGDDAVVGDITTPDEDDDGKYKPNQPDKDDKKEAEKNREAEGGDGARSENGGESYYYYDEEGMRKQGTSGEGRDAPHNGDGECGKNYQGAGGWSGQL